MLPVTGLTVGYSLLPVLSQEFFMSRVPSTIFDLEDLQPKSDDLLDLCLDQSKSKSDQDLSQHHLPIGLSRLHKLCKPSNFFEAEVRRARPPERAWGVAWNHLTTGRKFSTSLDS